jgi:hypothetical protein
MWRKVAAQLAEQFSVVVPGCVATAPPANLKAENGIRAIRFAQSRPTKSM